MGEEGSRTRRRCVRTVAVLCAALPLTIVGAPALGAEEFVNGEAEASAETFSLNVRTSNANIGFTYGRTLVNYRDTTGTAEARALDLGVLPTLFGVERCDGSPPTLNVATLPEVARVDSTEADAARSRRNQAFVPGLGDAPKGAAAGWQDATATPQPSARGTTESVDTDVFLLSLIGGRTESTATLVDGTREARAVSTADELRVLGGMFTFTNPRWEAVARSGARTTEQGTFTFERATVLGVPRTQAEALRDFDEFRRGLEDLLRPLGVTLRLPEVIVDEGRVRVTPMEFKVEDMPWGAQVIAPFLGNVQPLKEVLTQQLLDEDCKNDEGLLVLDVILSVLGGNGAVEISAGGADVFTADTDYSSPPLADFPVDGAPVPPVAVPDAPPPVEVAPIEDVGPVDIGVEDFSFDDSSFDDLGPETFAETVPSVVDTEVAAAAESTADEEIAAVPAATGGLEPTGAGAAAAAVGVVGLLGALALSFGDRLLARRNSRRIP